MSNLTNEQKLFLKKLVDNVEEELCQGSFNGVVWTAFELSEAVQETNNKYKTNIIFHEDVAVANAYLSFLENVRRYLI